MARKFFTKCFGCFCGHECGKTPRLPRKKKKQLKKFLLETDAYRQRYFMDFVSICDIVEGYKHYKKMFHTFNLIKEFKNEIDFLRSHSEEEGIYINEKGRLSWYWELDNDYGGSSGLMPFCYNEEEAKDTWAFSELKFTLFYALYYEKIDYDDFEFPKEIKSDKDLLKFIRKQNVTIQKIH